jgi:hypothetical protein
MTANEYIFNERGVCLNPVLRIAETDDFIFVLKYAEYENGYIVGFNYYTKDAYYNEKNRMGCGTTIPCTAKWGVFDDLRSGIEYAVAKTPEIRENPKLRALILPHETLSLF